MTIPKALGTFDLHTSTCFIYQRFRHQNRRGILMFPSEPDTDRKFYLRNGKALPNRRKGGKYLITHRQLQRTVLCLNPLSYYNLGKISSF